MADTYTPEDARVVAARAEQGCGNLVTWTTFQSSTRCGAQDRGDVTFTLGLIQHYDTIKGKLVDVSPREHPLRDSRPRSVPGDADDWLDVDEAKALRALLDRTIHDLETGLHLPQMP